jgi:hypothetical protein
MSKKSKSIGVALVFLVSGISLTTQTVLADSTEANCEFYKHGDKKHDRWGPCSFSQSSGYIDIKLKNGDTYSLSPRDGANQFKDQGGEKVDRTSTSADSQVYEWKKDEQKLVVTFNQGGGQAAQHSEQTAGESGQTPGDLKDLVGAKGGQGEEELSRRGYDFVKSEVAGDSVYANWKNRKTGQCIAIRTVNGRYDSIINSLAYDCNN